MSKKCQICDGPIVNGRCKFCGMPYRNDEELYHLNESSTDHYTHASARVRREMDENRIPLADRQSAQARRTAAKRTAANTYAAKKNATAANTMGLNESRADAASAARASAAGAGAARANTAAMNAARANTARTYTAGVNTPRTSTAGNTVFGGNKVKKKKGSGSAGWFFLVIVLLSVLPEGIDYAKHSIIPKLESIFQKEPDRLSPQELDDLLHTLILKKEDGEISVEEEGISPGKYRAVIKTGHAVVVVEEAGKTKEYPLSWDESQVVFELQNGQSFYLTDTDNSDRAVDIYCEEEYE